MIQIIAWRIEIELNENARIVLTQQRSVQVRDSKGNQVGMDDENAKIREFPKQEYLFDTISDYEKIWRVPDVSAKRGRG